MNTKTDNTNIVEVGDAVPDFEDPATLGCLFALILEAQDEQPHPRAVARMAEELARALAGDERGPFVRGFLAAAGAMGRES
jgi:hypothetical protein